MTTKLHRDPVLVVVQLSGGLDFMNTLIPYQSGIIRDARPTVSIPVEDTLPLDDRLAWHPSARALKELYDAGNVAVVNLFLFPADYRYDCRKDSGNQIRSPAGFFFLGLRRSAAGPFFFGRN